MDWRAKALCKGADPRLFYPPGNTSLIVKAVCGGCPVRHQCLSDAVRGDEYGIWGGTDRTQRQRLSVAVTVQ